MRLLVLTSRYTATRDIIGEDFGRQTRLFSALKKLGHGIDFICADYKKFENKNLILHGMNIMIRPFGAFYFFSFLSHLNTILKKNKYDFIIATSDPLWGVIGHIYSKKYDVRFVYDLHDNYETYATYKIPFFSIIDRTIIKKSDIITTVSHTLKNKVSKIRKSNVFVIQNGFDEKLFKPLNKYKCRKELKLPKHARIIGYAGSIQKAQGVDVLINAFRLLKKNMPEFYLILAGRFYGDEKKYFNLKQNGIIYLGSISQSEVVKLINASDVMVVPNTDNNFTRYCFPYKVVEYMACNSRLVATDLGDISMLLSRHKEALCKPNSSNDMAEKIRMQLNNKKLIDYRKTAMRNTWENIAKNLDNVLNKTSLS